MTNPPLPTQLIADELQGWKDDARAYRDQTRRYVAALRELHRAVDEHDGSDADVARLEDALVQAREMAPYVPEPPDPEGF